MVFDDNVNALMQVNPALAAKLMMVETNKRFEVFVDEKDPANINIYDKELEVPLYKDIPVKEIECFYDDFIKKYGRYPIIFMYGIGNGILLKMLLDSKSITKCYIFEPNLELLYIAFNLIDFSKDINSKRLNIYWEKIVDYQVFESICKNPDIKVFLKTYNLQIPLDYYLIHFEDNIKKINSTMVEHIKNTIKGEGNDAIDSLIGLDHHLQNIPKMVNSYTFTSLVQNKNTEYAVIVSTGPSLAKQLPLLKEYSDYITILCIDASLPILQKEGIVPDIVFSLERVEATAKFFENLDRELLKDTIFSPTSISHPKLIKNLDGMKQSIYMRPFGYTTMYRLTPWGYAGIGLSAANMAFDFAILAEFKHIAFIGQDLAFGESGTTHSKGAIYGEKEEQYKPELEIDGYYGGKVATTPIWAHFLHYFKANMHHAVVEKKLNIYNCTEGGAYIDGAKHIPFKEFLEKVDTTNKKSLIKVKKVSEEKANHYIRRVKKLLCIHLEKLRSIKKRVEDVFLEVMAVIEELEQLNRDKELENIDFDKLAAAIAKIDTIKDIYETDKAMKKFANITNPFIVNAELELARIMVTISDNEIEKKVKMIDWIYEHKSWLFFLAGALENIITVIERNYNEVYNEN